MQLKQGPEQIGKFSSSIGIYDITSYIQSSLFETFPSSSTKRVLIESIFPIRPCSSGDQIIFRLKIPKNVNSDPFKIYFERENQGRHQA